MCLVVKINCYRSHLNALRGYVLGTDIFVSDFVTNWGSVSFFTIMRALKLYTLLSYFYHPFED